MRKNSFKQDVDNIWYWLWTLGEEGIFSTGHDRETSNRRIWNRHVTRHFDDRAWRIIKELNYVDPTDLVPLTKEQDKLVLDHLTRRAGIKAINSINFNGFIDFSNTHFHTPISLMGYIFPIGTTFAGSNFESSLDLSEAIFLNWVNFDDALFSSQFVAASALFSDYAKFQKAEFRRTAMFAGSIFKQSSDFQGSIFFDNADFENCEFGGTTSFVDVDFRAEPPRFFGAKLHEGTIWRNVRWPLPQEPQSAAVFLEAYERLKLEMDRLKKHDDEQRFFVQELKCKRIMIGKIKGLPIAIYEFLCDCGTDYIRPFVLLIFFTEIGTLINHYYDKDIDIWSSLGLSISNTLSIFGLRKDFFDNSYLDRLPILVKIVSATQTVVGGICLFLFGLAIRNRFRMR